MKVLNKKEAALATMYICTNNHVTVTLDHLCMCKQCDAAITIVDDKLPLSNTIYKINNLHKAQ